MHENVYFFNLISYTAYTYSPLSQLSCSLDTYEVGRFNATILFSSWFGRSIAAPELNHISPDGTIYNFEAFARKFPFK